MNKCVLCRLKDDTGNLSGMLLLQDIYLFSVSLGYQQKSAKSLRSLFYCLITDTEDKQRHKTQSRSHNKIKW